MFRSLENDPDKKRIRWEFIILGCMYIGYMAFILCRTALGASSTQMVDDKSLGLTKTLFGQILAWGTAGMVTGKLLTGAIADRFGGRKVFLIALVITALVSIGFSFGNSYASFAAMNFFMLFAAAAGWPAMSNIIASWYRPEKFGRVWGIISTSSRLSSTLSMLFLGALLAKFSWHTIFRISGIVALFVVAFIFFYLKEHPKAVGLKDVSSQKGEEKEEAKKISHILDNKTLGQSLLLFLKSGRCWLICLSLMCTTVLMEFIGFIPLYLKESFKVSQAQASSSTSVFPAGCLIALIAGGFIYDKVSRKGRIILLGVLLAITCICIGILWLLPFWKLSYAFRIAIVTLFFYGLTVAPAYYIPMSIFSIEFGGKRCGLLIGIIDATGYLASMTYQSQGGKMVDNYGWQSMLTLLFFVAIASTFITIWFAFEDYRRTK